jgi:hypothetical protein
MAVDITHVFLSKLGGVRRPQLKAMPYHHDPQYKWVIDLRAYGKGRRFFRTKPEAEAFASQQRAMLDRHGMEAIGLSRRELSEIMEAKKRLALHGHTIAEAAKFFLEHNPAKAKR